MRNLLLTLLLYEHLLRVSFGHEPWELHSGNSTVLLSASKQTHCPLVVCDFEQVTVSITMSTKKICTCLLHYAVVYKLFWTAQNKKPRLHWDGMTNFQVISTYVLMGLKPTKAVKGEPTNATIIRCYTTTMDDYASKMGSSTRHFATNCERLVTRKAVFINHNLTLKWTKAFCIYSQ